MLKLLILLAVMSFGADCVPMEGECYSYNTWPVRSISWCIGWEDVMTKPSWKVTSSNVVRIGSDSVASTVTISCSIHVPLHVDGRMTGWNPPIGVYGKLDTINGKPAYSKQGTVKNQYMTNNVWLSFTVSDTVKRLTDTTASFRINASSSVWGCSKYLSPNNQCSFGSPVSYTFLKVDTNIIVKFPKGTAAEIKVAKGGSREFGKVVKVFDISGRAISGSIPRGVYIQFDGSSYRKIVKR